MFYKAVLLFAVMLFVLMLPWVQSVDTSPAPEATVAPQQEAAIQACCPEPWPCFPGEAMCAQIALTSYDH